MLAGSELTFMLTLTLFQAATVIENSVTKLTIISSPTVDVPAQTAQPYLDGYQANTVFKKNTF